MAHLQRQNKWNLAKLKFPKHGDVDKIARKIRHAARALLSRKKSRIAIEK
jgi:hypothetical protein